MTEEAIHFLEEDAVQEQSEPSEKETPEFFRDPFKAAEVSSVLSFDGDCGPRTTVEHPNPALACKAFR